ncbi:uncharacterized protein LOC130252859 [Oenanthe melanoleuca]|uniref:uncharacterized protein LOC130252859 n=1 Tax=Oenanthe melanoleuca TaxID=2939378 RepID=UPI0024C19F22|nr:uncharacterized protein LOC130252859 [Oenanthe melanoleuca]
MERGRQRQEPAEERVQEPWFQLPAEVQHSWHSWMLPQLGLGCASRDLSELEEGLLSSAEASGAAAPASPLDVQESRFSPCLPLLLSPAAAESFLQGSQLDFLPLRAIPDVSGASLDGCEPPQLPGAASLQGPALPSPSQYGQPRGPGEQHSWSTAGRDGPCPGPELPEGDRESPGQGEPSSSSSGGSSCQTALARVSGGSCRGGQQQLGEPGGAAGARLGPGG